MKQKKGKKDKTLSGEVNQQEKPVTEASNEEATKSVGFGISEIRLLSVQLNLSHDILLNLYVVLLLFFLS